MPNELVHLRIGGWILHPDAMVLPVAGLFFAVVAFRALRSDFTESAGYARFMVIAMCLGGVVGARIYGLFQPFYAGEPIFTEGAWRVLRFGSMGGIWGIFVASGTVAFVTRRAGVLTMWDAVVPAVATAAAIARVACVFQGCCVGVPTGPLAAIANPIYAWPFLDIAALLIALRAARFVSEKWCAPGMRSIAFLGAYGLLRFGAEILRDTFTATGNLTWGQILALVQILFAVGLAAYVRTRTAEQVTRAI